MTPKGNNLIISGTRFLGNKWVSDLNSEGLKTPKNTHFGTFPWVFKKGHHFMPDLVN
jgi:hypothetical protein